MTRKTKEKDNRRNLWVYVARQDPHDPTDWWIFEYECCFVRNSVLTDDEFKANVINGSLIPYFRLKKQEGFVETKGDFEATVWFKDRVQNPERNIPIYVLKDRLLKAEERVKTINKQIDEWISSDLKANWGR